jgi:aminoglycoside 3'-phosphotransferase-2
MRLLVRGAGAQRKAPECVPTRVAEWFPAAWWVPLSYQHPSRCWRIEDAASRQAIAYVKVSDAGAFGGVEDERRRLEWAAAKLPLAAVIDAGQDNGLDWMLLAPLRGLDGTSARLLKRPPRLVGLLATALRQLHAAPITGCPFDFRLPAAMAHVESRLDSGQINPADFRPQFRGFSAAAAVAELRSLLPAAEDPVITHGDYCVPNIVFDGDRLSGFVDVGALGVADRWRDLAVALWTLECNIGLGWDELFLETYGVTPDPARQAFYLLLYELAS